MPVSEANLINRIKQGDHTAMELLFKDHIQGAVRLAYLITKDWTTAEDATQEAFIQVMRSINSFKQGKPFKPWFSRIVINKAKRIKQKRKAEPAGDIHAENDHGSFSPEEMAIKREKERALFTAIKRLDENHRLPIILKYLNGLSEAEVASTLNLPPSTVKSRLYTARQRLKAGLIADGGEQGA